MGRPAFRFRSNQELMPQGLVLEHELLLARVQGGSGASQYAKEVSAKFRTFCDWYVGGRSIRG